MGQGDFSDRDIHCIDFKFRNMNTYAVGGQVVIEELQETFWQKMC